MIEVYEPCGSRREGRPATAGRPRTLEGLQFGILDNSKTNAAVLLEHSAALLSERGAKLTVSARKEIWGLPAPLEVIESLVHCEAVIAAHGG